MSLVLCLRLLVSVFIVVVRCVFMLTERVHAGQACVSMQILHTVHMSHIFHNLLSERVLAAFSAMWRQPSFHFINFKKSYDYVRLYSVCRVLLQCTFNSLPCVVKSVYVLDLYVIYAAARGGGEQAEKKSMLSSVPYLWLQKSLRFSSG